MAFGPRFLARLVLFGLLSLLGCQDDIGQGNGETTPTQANSVAGSNSAVNQGDGSSNASSNRQAADNTTSSSSGFTPEQEASREEDGAWKDVTQVTVIPQPRIDHGDNTAQFCNISYRAMGFALMEITLKHESINICSESPFNPYLHGYQSYQAERLLHIAGPRLPLEFELISFQVADKETMEEGKSYIVGFFLHDGKVFDHGSHLEVIPFDPEKENGRVKFSGKTEALIALGEAHIDDRKTHCQGYEDQLSPEEYEAFYLTRDQEFCDRVTK